MIVVDTNVLAYLYLPGEHTAAAETLLQQDPDWLAPYLWRSEFRNVLAEFLRHDKLTVEQALALQHEAENLMAGAEYPVQSATVLNLVQKSDCSAYDCEFVALAQVLNTSLVTMDRKVLRAFPDTAVPLPAAPTAGQDASQ